MKTYLLKAWQGCARRPVVVIVLVSLLAAALYLLGESSNYTYSDDSLPFAVRVWRGGSINSHHLVLFLLHELNTLLGLGDPEDLGRTQLLIRIYVALTSALTLSTVGLLLYRWTGSLGAGLAGMAMTASTYGFWAYSIVTDFYIPAGAFALLAILFADLAASSRRQTRLLFVSSMLVVVSSVNHQTYCLLTIPIFAGVLIYNRHSVPFATRARGATAFLLTTAVMGIGTFYVAFLADGQSENFYIFARGYSGWMKLFPYDDLQILTPVYVFIGILRSVVFLDFVQALMPVREFINSTFVYKATFDDWYLIHDLSPWLLYSALGIIVIASLLMVWTFPIGLIELHRARKAYRGPWIVMGWLPVQTVFFSWWEPLSNEFWIWMTPCLGILCGMNLAHARRHGGRLWLSWLLIGCLAAVNGIAISRYWSPDNSIYQINKTYLTRLDPQDLVLTADFYPIDHFHFTYEVEAHRLNFHLESIAVNDENLIQELTRVRNQAGSVYLDPMFMMPAQQEVESRAYLLGINDTEVERELLKLEVYCKKNSIPLYGVLRRGAEVVRFRKRTFMGHLKWVDHDLQPYPDLPASIDPK